MIFIILLVVLIYAVGGIIFAMLLPNEKIWTLILYPKYIVLGLFYALRDLIKK